MGDRDAIRWSPAGNAPAAVYDASGIANPRLKSTKGGKFYFIAALKVTSYEKVMVLVVTLREETLPANGPSPFRWWNS